MDLLSVDNLKRVIQIEYGKVLVLEYPTWEEIYDVWETD